MVLVADSPVRTPNTRGFGVTTGKLTATWRLAVNTRVSCEPSAELAFTVKITGAAGGFPGPALITTGMATDCPGFSDVGKLALSTNPVTGFCGLLPARLY